MLIMRELHNAAALNAYKFAEAALEKRPRSKILGGKPFMINKYNAWLFCEAGIITALKSWHRAIGPIDLAGKNERQQLRRTENPKC